MSTSISLPYPFHWTGIYPHHAKADVYGRGLLVEIVVVAIDQSNGDLYFIEVSALDSIDRDRIVKILTKRDAAKYPLWDLLSSTTLKNGVNALEYFNQLVKGRSVGGQIFSPMSGKSGAVASLVPRAAMQVAHQAQANVPAQPQVETESARRGPGRPPKA